MPELPTREELAAIIHERVCGCDCYPDRDECRYAELMVPAADAVLHRLMRDADTEYGSKWSGADDEIFSDGGQRRQVGDRDDGMVVSEGPFMRRSVTFTGEWEPAGEATT